MKPFWKPEAWKFAILAIIVLAAYAVFCSRRPLDFHESWSPAERQQIEACFRRCCDARSFVNETECAVFIEKHFPQNGSRVERACNWAYCTLGSYSQGLLFSYLNKSTRGMIEETSSTGNVMLVDKRCRSLLHLSLAYEFTDLTVSLVKRGADVNLRSVLGDGSLGDTPLSCAADSRTIDLSMKSISKCREMVDCLLAHGADIKNDFQVTIKGIVSVESNKTKEAEEFLCYLLEKGAPLSETTSERRSRHDLLHAVIELGMPDCVVRALLNHGADFSKLTAEEQKKVKSILEEYDLDES